MAAAFPEVHGVTTFLEAPEGYVVDFEHPQERHVLDHYLIFGVLGLLALVCLVQRLYTKHFISGGLKVDDYLITLAWIASLIMQSVQIWSISIGGLGHHAWEMSIQVFEKHMLSSYIVAPTFITCNGLSKTSLLTFYLRISPQKWFRITIFAAIGMVAGYTSVIAGLLLFGCRPIPASWDPYLFAKGQCVDQASLYIAIAVANIVSDVVLFIIPIPTVIGLKMPLAQKLGAALMFGVGSFTVATSVVRMVYLPSLLGATDIPWVATRANVWSFIEVNLFIICGSMPTFRKFLKRFAPRIMGTWVTRQSKSQGYVVSESTSTSRFARQQRTGYSQFDEDVEMDNVTDQGGNVVAVQGITTGEPGHSTAVDCEAASPTPHQASKDTAVDTDNIGGIACTKTFQVQYSKE